MKSQSPAIDSRQTKKKNKDEQPKIEVNKGIEFN